MDRLTVVVRADLPAGAQLAQSCHALAAFAVSHEAPFAAWQPAGAIVCLSVPDEPALAALLERAAARGLRRAAYREPDMGAELTAVALGDGAKPLTSGLPLALRGASASDRSSASHRMLHTG